MEIILLTASAFVAATISGAIGMGGGTILIAVMASILPGAQVVPLHGLVQMTSNASRTLILLRRVAWWAFGFYVPLQLVGVYVAGLLYRDTPQDWLRPIIGAFLLATIAWKRLKPKRLDIPRWIFALGGFGGGILSIFVGVTGPYLAAFFLRDDMEKEEIVATKAAIQMVGHVAKIPVFIAVGFPYREHIDAVIPLLAAALIGTFVGTRLLRSMAEKRFRTAFDTVLGLLALRLLLEPVL